MALIYYWLVYLFATVNTPYERKTPYIIWTPDKSLIYICLYIYIYMCVCVCIYIYMIDMIIMGWVGGKIQNLPQHAYLHGMAGERAFNWLRLSNT